MGRVVRWMCVVALLAIGSYGQSENGTVVRTHSVDGDLDSEARLQALHAEMKRECGAAPGSSRCERLKREFHQEAKNCQKQKRK